MKIGVNVHDHPVAFTVLSLILCVGGIFAIFYMFTPEGIFDFRVFLIAMVLITFGFLCLFMNFRRLVALAIHERLLYDLTAYETKAKLIHSSVTYTITNPEGITFEAITYAYRDENGIYREVVSIKGIDYGSIQYLRQKEDGFKIRCKGKYSAIIEEIPGKIMYFN